MGLAALLVGASPLRAQDEIVGGVAAIEARAGAGDLAGALRAYREHLRTRPTDLSALCNAARIGVDLAEFERNAPRKDSLYAESLRYARRAVEVSPTTAEAHFHVARALGHTALGASPRERVRLAVEVKERAQTALRYHPDHPGALHIVGMWHAEVMRLNGIARTMARTFLGGSALAEASWAEAIRTLERAVALEPQRIVHRLDLALIYRDVGRPADARAQLDRIAQARPADYNDPQYQRAAAEARARLR
jgi:tetratricopeptide (TPR) repeat protein